MLNSKPELSKNQKAYARDLRKQGVPGPEAEAIAARMPSTGRIILGSPLGWMSRSQELHHCQSVLITTYIQNSNGWTKEERFTGRILALAREFRVGAISDGSAKAFPGKINVIPTIENFELILSAVAQENTIGQAMNLIIRSGLGPGGFPLLCKLASVQGEVGRAVTRFTEAIKHVAWDFGLRPSEPSDEWWGYHWLHYLVSSDSSQIDRGMLPRPAQEGFRALTIPGLTTWKPEKTFNIQWDISQCGWGKRQVEQHILDIFKEQWEEATQILFEQDYTFHKQTEESKHIRWLYLAICPSKKLARPLTYQEIADREEAGEDALDTSTVTKAVGRLGRRLDIDVGKRRGRRASTSIVNSK
ncbi:MAG: hypothetical protein QGI56_12565 [Dehalococcoidia bacterium]|nr:hypothetical protein [Dehalococcoidia bacterium]